MASQNEKKSIWHCDAATNERIFKAFEKYLENK